VRPSIRYIVGAASLLASSLFGLPSSASASEVTMPAPVHTSIPWIHPARISTVADSTYTVQAGDTLSGIASMYAISGGWKHLYGINADTVTNPNEITVGQTLKLTGPIETAVLSARHKAHLAHLAEEAKYRAQSATIQVDSAVQPEYTSPAPVSDEHVNAGDYSGFQSCVIARESGGNSQVMNSSGHYGLYQFSESTWEAYGGSASDFGHASVQEQNQVFDNAMAQGGEGNWSAYDGC
jgi:LysM repeat protein